MNTRLGEMATQPNDHALVTLLPQGPAALVRAVEPARETLRQRLDELAQVVHPASGATINPRHRCVGAKHPRLRDFLGDRRHHRLVGNR